MNFTLYDRYRSRVQSKGIIGKRLCRGWLRRFVENKSRMRLLTTLFDFLCFRHYRLTVFRVSPGFFSLVVLRFMSETKTWCTFPSGQESSVVPSSLCHHSRPWGSLVLSDLSSLRRFTGGRGRFSGLRRVVFAVWPRRWSIEPCQRQGPVPLCDYLVSPWTLGTRTPSGSGLTDTSPTLDCGSGFYVSLGHSHLSLPIPMTRPQFS